MKKNTSWRDTSQNNLQYDSDSEEEEGVHSNVDQGPCDTNRKGNAEYVGPFKGLKGPRRLWVTAVFWILGGWAGLHRLYLGDPGGARMMFFTFGCCLFGCLRDGTRLQTMVNECNEDNKDSTTRIVHTMSASTAAKFGSNRVTNTKYGATNIEMAIKFLPLSLMEQMEQFTNRYFLFIAILQLDPHLTPANPLTTWLPLLIIFGFTAARELADDRLRFAADREANGRMYGVAKDGAFVQTPSERLRVGDVVVVGQDQEVPADMVLLASSNHEPTCYLETANLDGESDLKLRLAVSITSSDRPPGHPLATPFVPRSAQLLEIEVPKLAAREMQGLLRLEGHVAPLSEQQSLLQGSVLRNTHWVCGAVVYSGNETRLGRSRRVPGAKRARTDHAIDKLSSLVFLVQASVAIALGVFGNAWTDSSKYGAWYLDLIQRTSGAPATNWDMLYEPSVIPLRFLLLMSTMIPLSMQVTMDTCKWMYSLWITWDDGLTRSKAAVEGRHSSTPEQDGAHVRNSDIAEDLGQVDLLLMDKTGTLTENKMLLKVLTVGGRLFGLDHAGDHGCNSSMDVSHDSQLQSNVASRRQDVLQALRVLAMCNSVATVTETEDMIGDIHYEACSPDEEALVMSAARMNVVLEHRGIGTVRTRVLGELEKYRVLKELEFTSDRKRMSVILECEATGTLLMLTKGADESVHPLLAAGQDAMIERTCKHVEDLARLGLRTLLLAWKEVPRSEYDEWEKLVWRPANISLESRAARMAHAYDAIEHGLRLLGGTGIEDRLQEGVPESIRALREAGVRLWMATGDKLSTARQVAVACGLLGAHGSENSTVVTLAVPSQIDASLQVLDDSASRRRSCKLSRGRQLLNKGGFTEEFGVVVTGACLAAMSKQQKRRLIDAAYFADAVLCCRLTPDQKAELVLLVRDNGQEDVRHVSLWGFLTASTKKLTGGSLVGRHSVVVAVGDGANDVAMIQVAHIGIGLVGREGSQAVRASDVSVLQFRDLPRLMLYHGAYCYQRSAIIAQLSFFKSWAFCFGQVMFACLSGYSGTSYYDAFSISACNALLFIPLCFYSLNRPLPRHLALQRPELYRSGPSQAHMNHSSISLWLARAVVQSVLCFQAVVLTLGSSHVAPDGHPVAFVQVSTSAFSLFLIVQCCNVLLEMHTWTVLQVCVVVCGLAFAFALYATCNSIVALGALVDFHALFNTARDPCAVLLAPLVIFGSMLPVLIGKYWKQSYAPGPLELARMVKVQSQRSDRGIAMTPLTPGEGERLLKGSNVV